MLKKLFLIISLLVTILFSQTIYAQDDSLEEESEEGPEIIPVGVATATEGTIHQLLQFTGETNPFIEAYVTADVNGPVSEVNIEIGEKVKKGQVLCCVNTARFEIALRQAKAELEKAKQQFIEDEKDYKRNETLFKSKAITQKNLDSALTAYISSKATRDAAQANYDEAKLNLERCSICSPIDGYFADRNVEIGQTLSTGDRIGKILNMDNIYIDARISAADIDKISEGQKCLIDGKYEGTVEFMTFQADASRAFKVRILVCNNPMVYRAKTYVKGSITLSTYKSVPVFPSAALRFDKDNDKYFVYKIVDNKAIKQYVEIITQEGDYSHAQNVNIDDVLVVQGQENLSDGCDVVISM